MTTATPIETAARRLLTAIDSQDWAAARELCAPEARVRIGGQEVDRDGWVGMGRMFAAAFPDGAHTIDEVVAEGDRVVLRCTWRGTHRGAFQGVPASGRTVAVPAILVERFDGARLRELHGVFDALGLLQQIGAFPSA
jgi:steroid delta-isomerase-like uncharacterized protein